MLDKIGNVRFLSENEFITTTWESAENHVQLYTINSTRSYDIKHIQSTRCMGDIQRYHYSTHLSYLPTSSLVLSSTSYGQVHLYEYTPGQGLVGKTNIQVFEKGSCLSTHALDQYRDPSIVSVSDYGDLAYHKLDGTLEGYHKRATGMAFTDVLWTGYSQVAATSSSGQLLIFDKRQAKPSQVMVRDAHLPSPLNCLAVHPTQMAVGTREGDIQMWDIRANKDCLSYQVHSADVWQLLFHPIESETIVSCSEDGTVGLLNLNTEYHVSMDKRLRKEECSPLGMNSVDCNPDSNVLIAGGDEGAIKIIK